MKIKEIKIRKILDSKKEETFEIEMLNDRFSVVSSVGKGKSRGSKEVFLIDFQKAKEIIKEIKNLIIKRDFSDLKEFDQFLLSLDGTPDKKKLGGNLILTLSVAFSKLLAKERGLPLFVLLREEFLRTFPEFKEELNNYQFPYLFFNFINGGLHSKKGPNFQEYLIIPQNRNPDFSLNLAKIFFAGLKEWFKKNDISISYGDEGGLIYPGKDDEKPLEIFSQVLKDLNLNYRKIRFGLDVAASSFLKEEEKEKYLDFYKYLIQKYQLFSLEDPFSENDILGFKKILNEFKNEVIIIGDDLTVTNAFLIEKAADFKAIDGVIIKPTQIGSLLETFQAISVAFKKNLKIIISHRSRETNDDFLADLTLAINAFGFKSGALTQKERLVKYLRIKKIKQILRK
jgi:enolase